MVKPSQQRDRAFSFSAGGFFRHAENKQHRGAEHHRRPGRGIIESREG
ncbi:Uncharacterised protein [Klebsiella pneumoniae]|nr:Uncharacterised protein [Klebsiella pneumoniae]